MKKIKILIITYLPWRNDTSIGNSFSNIFNETNDKYEFSHIYFRDDKPDNNIVKNYFQISENQLLKNFISRHSAGKVLQTKDIQNNIKSDFNNKYKIIRNLRWDFFLLIRDIISLYGPWKSEKLNDFIRDYKPDLVFGILDHIPVINKLMVEICNKYNIPLVAYAWDDFYNQNQYSLSPFSLIKNKIEKNHLIKCVNKAEFLYTISKEMQEEYTTLFNKKCKLLYKGYNFDKYIEYKYNNKAIEILYTGNIGDYRWKTLSEVVKSLKQLNEKEKIKYYLKIYTLSPITKNMEKALNVENTSKLMSPVSASEVLSVLEKADIVLQVEPFGKKRQKAKLSFSTKIVDYMYVGKCMVAIGGSTAALEYLRRNDAAIIIDEKDKIIDVFSNILNNLNKINNYSKNAWNCGRRHHDINKIQRDMYNEFFKLTNES